MDLFSDLLSRLKHELRTSKDQDVAAALGMSKTAFSERKKRNSFPDRELLALAEARPELGIDVSYVLTGESRQAVVDKMALNLGARFREIRGERSVEQFAQLLETTPHTISGIEAQSELPSTELLKKLTDTHPDIDLIWLWGGESPKLDSPLTGIETILVMNYRASSKEGQASIRRMAAFHATYQNED